MGKWMEAVTWYKRETSIRNCVRVDGLPSEQQVLFGYMWLSWGELSGRNLQKKRIPVLVERWCYVTLKFPSSIKSMTLVLKIFCCLGIIYYLGQIKINQKFTFKPAVMQNWQVSSTKIVVPVNICRRPLIYFCEVTFHLDLLFFESNFMNITIYRISSKSSNRIFIHKVTECSYFKIYHCPH